MNQLEAVTHYLQRVITRPRSELTRWQRSLRFAIDLARHCTRELRQDQATTMAAALAFRTIFSLVPLAAFALLIFRAFADRAMVRELLINQLYTFFNIEALELHTNQGQAMATSIQEAIDPLIEKAWTLDLGSVGIVGLGVLIWAALALLVTVEQSFNRVFKAPAGRPWHLRIMIYWAIVTLGPLLLFVSLYVAGNLYDTVRSIEGFGPWLAWMPGFTALAASWVLLFLLYSLMPSTSVKLKPALAGSLVAAILWEMGKFGFKLYAENASLGSLYGALGLIPLFLIWLYITWLIVLFGLEVTYTLQAMSGGKFDLHDRTSRGAEDIIDPAWLLPVMVCIGKAFRQGRVVEGEEISRSLRIPNKAVRKLTQQLEEARLINTVTSNLRDERGHALAKPPNEIRMTELIEICRNVSLGSEPPDGNPDWAVYDQMNEAQRKAVTDLTLADMLKSDNKLTLAE